MPRQKKKKFIFVWIPIVYLNIYLALIAFSSHVTVRGTRRKFKREHANNIRKTWVTMAALCLTGWVTLGNILRLNYLTPFYYLKNVDNDSYST